MYITALFLSTLQHLTVKNVDFSCCDGLQLAKRLKIVLYVCAHANP